MLNTREVIKVSSWVMSLVTAVGGKHGKIHFWISRRMFEETELLPNVNGTIQLRDGTILNFEMILMRKRTQKLFPYLSMVSHGPMSRNYYPEGNTWVKS